ncbi:rhodanese-like domain-containing protein [Helicobacter sp.]|uniref:rhodanese-like domain-containing protein n=1 Tax=Helicobacter sp. TaxID=218 RepID=UPI0025C58ADC|nr:rhodanese-like domain-containing protein [Helicobacter sp.]MBR2493999.1 rhodanese-like domain-containing protein [Helicobacter sp.]
MCGVNTGSGMSYSPIHPSSAESVCSANLAALLENIPDVQIIDIREASDYVVDHIDEARNFPMQDFASLSQEILANPQTAYLLHCYSGYTVAVYGSYLVEMGAKNVYYFDESFYELKQALRAYRKEQ